VNHGTLLSQDIGPEFNLERLGRSGLFPSKHQGMCRLASDKGGGSLYQINTRLPVISERRLFPGGLCTPIGHPRCISCGSKKAGWVLGRPQLTERNLEGVQSGLYNPANDATLRGLRRLETQRSIIAANVVIPKCRRQSDLFRARAQ